MNITSKKYLEVFKKYLQLGWMNDYMMQDIGLSKLQIAKLRKGDYPSMYADKKLSSYAVMQAAIASQPATCHELIKDLLPHFDNNQTAMSNVVKINSQTANRIVKSPTATFGKTSDHVAFLELWTKLCYPAKLKKELENTPASPTVIDKFPSEFEKAKEQERINILAAASGGKLGMTLDGFEDLEPLKPGFKSDSEKLADKLVDKLRTEDKKVQPAPQLMDVDEKTKIFTNLGIWFYKTQVEPLAKEQ